MSSDEGQKEELGRLMRHGGQKGREISEKSAEFGQFGHQVADLASAGERVLKYVVPSRVDLQPKIDAWRFLIEQEDDLLGHLKSISMPTASTAGTVSAEVMMDFARQDTVIRYVQQERQNDVAEAAERLSAVIGRQADKKDVLLLMRRCGLSQAVHRTEQSR